MGLSVLHPDEPWIELDADLGTELREKARLFGEHHSQVYVELSRSLDAQREVRDTLAEYLCDRHPDQYSIQGECLRVAALDEDCVMEGPGLSPLEAASRWIQEDLCIMEEWDGAWRLSAGSVCFPTRWDLPSKLGLPLSEIHTPVPGYQEKLAVSADRFFARLKTGRTVWRVNWSLTDIPDLFQPGGGGRVTRVAEITSENAGDRVWLRVERQTLRRFPRSGAILFTIRVHRSRLRDLRADPGAAEHLAGSLRSMDPDLHRYKSLPVLHDAVTEYLQATLSNS